MSGHSHYATIKRQKESRDAARGRVFSKLARAISVAVKAGGGGDADANPKLRFAVESARAANMPKGNIERAISRAEGVGETLEEVSYEGFGPGGVGVIVEAATDNRNRTGQEIKNLFERGGGSLAGPGSVTFNFEPKGFMLIQKSHENDEQTLRLIDAGADDIEETKDGVEIYTEPSKLAEVRDKVLSLGYKIDSFELVRKPKNLQVVNEASQAQKVLKLLESLEGHGDVVKIYANVDIPNEILEMIKSS